ncbi:non-specific lipid-transfer protein-like [Andrographis paniculata]|uniref:non-specific lipid-transfer protein-like n=1 Tax=Andrographis paniculata TaxID=175694 RepID=UPI0021E99177|nr:non-specific lipid-transfer protein-like [Andrographis paniculata]
MTALCTTRWFAAMAVLAAMLIASCDAVIRCNDAVTQVIPCESFLLGQATAPTSVCCNAVKNLDSVASASQPDRKAICECFKQTARSFPVNLPKAQQLPQLCQVNIPVGIDPSVDCNTI